MQGDVIGAEGLEQDAKDPRKQGLSANADNASPQFCPQSNYFEQILTLFDQLPIEEQERILSLLEARIKTSVK